MKPVGVAYLLFLALAADAMPNYGSNTETCKKLTSCLNFLSNSSLPTLCPRYNKDFVFVQDNCAKFDQSITSLKESMAKFCDPKMYSEYDYDAVWTPLEPMDLGNIDMSVTTPQNYRLPQSVPGTANEVLIYVWIKVGYASSGKTTINFYTEDETGKKFSKYMTTEAYPQTPTPIPRRTCGFQRRPTTCFTSRWTRRGRQH
ncbi:hypothetical protein GBAR_LOCUS28070 [Geodia barretti]|uniref:Uncharacterized protein n=1 Tax=Geodia barretti TaxID=519541 RepID=A0AA35TQG8_GEOBA|nr:hypothetical protein GBAR_LOCUS28070 [Geodia barretti]